MIDHRADTKKVLEILHILDIENPDDKLIETALIILHRQDWVNRHNSLKAKKSKSRLFSF